MTKAEGCELRDSLVAFTPRFPRKISLLEMQIILQARKGIDLSREQLAHHLKKAIRQGHISIMGRRGYTRPANPTEKAQARSWVKPGPSRPRHNATHGLRDQLKAANAAIRAELEGA